MLTDVSQRYSRQYSFDASHCALKFNENFPFRIFFFFSSWILRGSFFFFCFFCFVLDSLMSKNFNSWILRFFFLFFFFNSLLLKHVYLFAALFELSSRDMLSAWLSVWLPFVRSFVALSGTKSQSKNNIISHFWFCLPSPVKQSANRCSAIEWAIDKTLLRVRLCSTEFRNRTIPVRIGRISESSIRYLLYFAPL